VEPLFWFSQVVEGAFCALSLGIKEVRQIITEQLAENREGF
jgi:hypothetical protein